VQFVSFFNFFVACGVRQAVKVLLTGNKKIRREPLLTFQPTRGTAKRQRRIETAMRNTPVWARPKLFLSSL